MSMNRTHNEKPQPENLWSKYLIEETPIYKRRRGKQYIGVCWKDELSKFLKH